MKFWLSLTFGVATIVATTVLCLFTISYSRSTTEIEALSKLETAVSSTSLANQRIIHLLASHGAIPATTSTPSAALELRALLTEYGKSTDAQVSQVRQVVDSLKKSSSDTGALAPYANLITGGLVVGLLAFLGLTRLGQIDQEIRALRETLLREVADRSKLAEDALTGRFNEAISKARESIERTSSQAEEQMELLQQSALTSAATNKEAQETARLETERVLNELQSLPEKFPFLMNKHERDLIAQVDDVSNVEEAEDVASRLHNLGDRRSAKLALRAIVDRELLGSADQYHNAHSEAMRLGDVILGLAIADLGLKRYPRNADLAADKVLAMCDSGSPDEASNFGLQWLAANRAIARTWRFGVFLSRAIVADGTEGALDRASKVLKEEIESSPRNEKLWSQLAQITSQRDASEALLVLDSGLQFCPTSQELKFVKGQFLLELSRATEAKEVLESAVASDFQDQFQPKVNQPAVMCYYAQALEATNQREAAIAAYTHTLDLPGCHPVMARFIQGRIKMLAMLDGKSVNTEADLQEQNQALIGLLRQITKGENESRRDSTA